MKQMLPLFIIMIILLKQELIKSYKCGAHLEEKKSKILINRGYPINEWEPLKIHFDFTFIENFNSTKLNLMREKIMPNVALILSKLLKVKRTVGNLTLNDNSCGNLEKIPKQYLTNGVDANIIIFILMDVKKNYTNIGASALHCFQDQITNRPIAGFIKFNPDFKITNLTLNYMVELSIHEITHILVMNPSLYDDWIDANGKRLGIGNVIITKPDNITYINTVEVRKQAYKHFGSDWSHSMVPLEDEGGEGTAGSHWEKKSMNTDYMNPELSGENLISPITLALFIDSGWYKTSYELADNFIWGKNQSNYFTDNFENKNCMGIKCKIMDPLNHTCLNRENTTINIFENSFCANLTHIGTIIY